MENTIQKYDFIDALRGLAILGVVMVHTYQWVPLGGKIMGLVANNGARGVQLFFIASALTLFLSNDVRRTNEDNPTRNFFIRRFFRIAPMYYLGIIVYVLVEGFAKTYWAPNGIQWWYVALNFAFLHGWHPETFNSVVPGGWSIAVEFTFYLFLPILFNLIKSIKSSLIFLCGSIILGKILSYALIQWLLPLYPGNQNYLIYAMGDMWFFAQVQCFGVGAFVFHIIRSKKILPNQIFGYALFLWFLILGAISLVVSALDSLSIPYYLYELAFGFLTISLFHVRIRILVNPIVCWLGKISFSIYLVHFLVIRVLSSAVPQWFLHGDFGLILSILIVLVISAGISAITYAYIERPGIKMGKWLIQRLNMPIATTTL